MNTLNKQSDAEGLHLGPVKLFTKSEFDKNFGTRFDWSRVEKLLKFLGVQNVNHVAFDERANVWAPVSRSKLITAAKC
ncbi:MAG: hypothetical protein WCO12_00980 [bacterium]